MVNWSPRLQTAVSDLEVEHSEEPGYMYYLKYDIDIDSDVSDVSSSSNQREDDEFIVVLTRLPYCL